MSLAHHLLLSLFDAQTPPPPPAPQAVRGAPSVWLCLFDMSNCLLSTRLPVCTSRCSSSPGISRFPRKNHSFKWRMVFRHQILPVNAFIASGMALLSNIGSKQSREYLLCVLRVIVISVFIYLKTTCLYSHVQFQFNTTGHILTLPLVYL